MKGIQVGVLSATSHSLSLAISSEHPRGCLDNASFKRLCEEGPLLEILSREYEDLSSFLRELSYHKVQTDTIFLDERLPTVRWALNSKKPCLSVMSDGAEGVIFSIRVKRER